MPDRPVEIAGGGARLREADQGVITAKRAILLRMIVAFLQSDRQLGRAVRLAATAAAAAGLYFLLAGQVSANESAAAMLPIILALLLDRRWSRYSRQKFSLRAPWGKILWATAIALPRDSCKVGSRLIAAILARPPNEAGASARLGLRVGGDNAADAGRRAILVLAASLPPNGFVLGVSEPGGMTLHRLAPASRPADPEWPI